MKKITIALAAAAMMLPGAAKAQSFTTIGGGYSFDWTIGTLNATQVYIDVQNTSPAGYGIGAMAFWLTNANLTASAMSVGAFGGVTGGGASGSDWDKDVADWASNWQGGQFGDIAGYDLSTGLTTSGNGGIFASAGAGNFWLTTGANNLRFIFTVGNTAGIDYTSGYAGFRGQGGATSWSCGFDANGALTNPAEGCATTPDVDINLQSVTTPEPSSYALMAAGLAALGFAARRRRNKA